VLRHSQFPRYDTYRHQNFTAQPVSALRHIQTPKFYGTASFRVTTHTDNKILRHSQFPCYDTYGLTEIVWHSQFPCYDTYRHQNFTAQPVSVLRHIQTYRNFIAQPVSVLRHIRTYRSFMAQPISVLRHIRPTTILWHNVRANRCLHGAHDTTPIRWRIPIATTNACVQRNNRRPHRHIS
jgi:hypothetical protein